jgi:hypothetical protein
MHDVRVLDLMIPEPGAIYISGLSLSGFRANVSDRPGRRIFRNSRKIESSDQATILAQSRSFDRPNLRPDCHTDRLLFEQGLQQTCAENPIHRARNGKDIDLLDQSFCLARTNYHRALSKSMASGIICNYSVVYQDHP